MKTSVEIFLLVLFSAWIILQYVSRSAYIFNKYNLHSNKLDLMKMGFSAKRIREEMHQTENNEIKNELKRSLLFMRVSNYTLIAFLILFVTYIFVVN